MEMQTTLPEVIVERQGAIGRLRLNRPRALNSLNRTMIRAIAAALTEFERDPGIAAVLVTGEGERGRLRRRRHPDDLRKRPRTA